MCVFLTPMRRGSKHPPREPCGYVGMDIEARGLWREILRLTPHLCMSRTDKRGTTGGKFDNGEEFLETRTYVRVVEDGTATESLANVSRPPHHCPVCGRAGQLIQGC